MVYLSKNLKISGNLLIFSWILVIFNGFLVVFYPKMREKLSKTGVFSPEFVDQMVFSVNICFNFFMIIHIYLFTF